MVSLVNESEKIEQLKKLTESLFGPEESIFSSKYSAPFDISRPNIHDSKKEFIRELITVTAVKDHLRGTLDLLLQSISPEDRDPLQTAMTKRLSVAIETFALQRVKSETLDGASDLALKNIRDTGFYFNSLFVVIEMHSAFDKRLKDLKEQEVQFWTVANRPPNYYARTIALRFARLFASRTGKRPTFGISSEGPHPSTDYGRALEQVFAILEISANVRKAAEWALSQVTEEDWGPKPNALAGSWRGLRGLAGIGPPPPGPHGIAKLLLEKGE